MHNQKDTISVVLPVYNGEKYIEASILSVLRQTYQNIELIIIDDCSTDKTPEIVKRIQATDKRVFYFWNNRNLNLPVSLNKGFRLAKGVFLTWTSDDNIYAPEAFEVMLKELKDYPDCNLVYTAYTFIDERGDKLDTFSYSPEYFLFKCVIGGSFLYTRKLYSAIGEYDSKKFRMEDYDFWIRAFKISQVRFINRPGLYYYRKHKESLSSGIIHNKQIQDEYKKNYKETFAYFLNDFMLGDFSDKELDIHTDIFFNDLMKISYSGETSDIDVADVFAYFEKMTALEWSKTFFSNNDIIKAIDSVKIQQLSFLINNLIFINRKLTSQNPQLAKRLVGPVSWYYKEYEVLPSWYKKIGHLIKAIQRNRSWRSFMGERKVI